jgi:uncharacterized protein (DUF488 family)
MSSAAVQPARQQNRILTVGHSNHSWERFLELLKSNSVEVVVDARSHPYSKFSPQFDSDSIRKSLGEAGILYVPLGSQLGGRPRGDDFYDANGHVLYDRVAASELFRQGIERLKKGVDGYVVALMCGEEDPAGCHRRLLIGRVLLEEGFSVDHIRGDGRIQPDNELEVEPESTPQLSLFEAVQVPAWKSIPSVSLKRRQSSSSAF